MSLRAPVTAFFLLFLLSSGLYGQNPDQETALPSVESNSVNTDFLSNGINLSNKTEVLVNTNILKEPVIFYRVMSNTNIKGISITNTAGGVTNINESLETNIEAYVTNAVFIFYDPFRPLSPIETLEEMEEAVSELLFPLEFLQFTNTEPRWARKVRLKNPPGLLTDPELYNFSEKAFRAFLYRKLFNRLAMTEEENRLLSIGFETWETKVIVQGAVELTMGYGWVFKDESYTGAMPGINTGFTINQQMRVNVVGKIGDRINVSIDHNSQSSENIYEIAYKALAADRGILKQVKFGNIELNIPKSSSYINYSGVSKDSYGIWALFQQGDWSAQALLNLITSKKGYKQFTGRRLYQTVNITDTDYIRRRYFQMPDVNIDGGSFELLVSTSDSNTYDRRIGGLYFRRLREGKDYSLNYTTGQMTLSNSLDRNLELTARYLHSAGNPFTTNGAPSVQPDNSTGELFLSLWQPTNNYSPYVHYGYYSIGYTGFDLSRGFSMVLAYSSSGLTAERQFALSDYEVNPATGQLRFKDRTPFMDTNSRIYTNASDPNSFFSVYTLKVSFYNPVQTYRLDFDVVPNSEKVYVNGRLLSIGEYTLIDSIGELVFNNPNLISDNDNIEVYYEYKPFWSGSQKYGLAARIDYKPNNLVNAGSTIIYNIAQRDASAPYVTATPDGTLLADIDGNLNMGKILGLSDDWNWTLKGEGAVSVVDRNTIGYAIIDDMEAVGDIYAFSKNESRWVLAAPVSNIGGITLTNRGRLLYRDYLTSDGILLNYNSAVAADKTRDYSVKAGPYLTYGGHLSAADFPNVRQTSLLFDVDFSQGEWVGAAYSLGGASGIDLSTYSSVSMWVRLQSDSDLNGTFEDAGTMEADLFIAVGQFNEDADGNGVLDGENDPSDAGYPFHNALDSTAVDTWIGRGRLLGGDGYKQSEDLNRNGVLDTNANLIIFPSPGYTDLSNITLVQGQWQKIDINLKSLSINELSALEHASALGLYIRKKNGSRGRLIIDSLEFKKVSWKRRIVDGQEANDSLVIKGEPLSIQNNTNYAKNRFYNVTSGDTNANERALLFEKLHGTRTITEAAQYNEKALAINYNLTNVPVDISGFPVTGGTSGSLLVRSASAYDISRYGSVVYYIFIPEKDESGVAFKQGGDTWDNERFTFTLGSTVSHYFTWEIPMTAIPRERWVRMEIIRASNYALYMDRVRTVDGPAVTGMPSLMSVTEVRAGIRTTDTAEPVNRGQVWLNEVFVQEDESYVGTAYFLQSAFQYKKPVWKIMNAEILGPVNLDARLENKGYGFISTEGGSRENQNDNFNVSFQTSLFKDLGIKVSYNQYVQGTSTNETDVPWYLQYNSAKNTFAYNLVWTGRDFIPTVNHNFMEDFDTRFNRTLSADSNLDAVLNNADDQYTSSVSLTYDHNLPIMKGFTLSPQLSYEDSYYLFDRSSFSNRSVPEFLTNAGLYGMQNLKKNAGAGLRLFIGQFNLNGQYKASIEKFNQIYDVSGYRSELSALRQEGFFSRLSRRYESAAEFFNFTDEPLDRYNSDTFSLNFSADRPLPWLSFFLNDSLTRTSSGYIYTNSILTYRVSGNSLQSDNGLSLFPKVWILQSIVTKLKRGLTVNSSSTAWELDLTNALTRFGEITYNHPLFYNGLLFNAYGRSNSLDLASRVFDTDPSSTVNLSDILSMELNLVEIPGFWGLILPRRYFGYSQLYTSRNQNSYVQSMENYFETAIPIRMGLILASNFGVTNSPVGIGDLQAGLNYRSQVYYNDRKGKNTLSFTLSENFSLPDTQNINFRYTYSWGSEFLATNTEPFDITYGIPVFSPSVSPMATYSHNAVVQYNWTVKNLKEINLGFLLINLRGSNLENRETLSFTSDTYSFDGLRFSTLLMKIYEIALDHQSQYKFTDFITGSFSGRVVLNQYAELTPARTSYFDPGLGLQLNMNVKFTF